MNVFALAHAPKGASFVVQMMVQKNEDEGTKAKAKDPVLGKLICTRLKDDPSSPPKARAKAGFLEKIKPGDVVILEMGGASDKLALAAVAFGAEVHRYPSFLLAEKHLAVFAGVDYKKGAKDEEGTSVDEIGTPLCLRLGTKWKAEKAFSEETGDVLSLRKLRALTLWSLWEVKAPNFYKMETGDVLLLRLKFAIRSYMRSYKATMRSYQGILSAYRDQVFIDLAFGRQLKADALEEAIHSEVLEKLVQDILGGEISDTEREDFFSQIGKEFEGGRLPARASEETIATLVESFMASDRFKSTVFSRLKSQKLRIEKMLDGGKMRGDKETFQPNDLYRAVFKPITGCGPMIAARFIVGISDVRRFPTFAAFKAYCGLHHFSDGSRARRRKGHVSNWKTELKQAIHLLTDQVVKVKREKKAGDAWCAKLDARKAYELVKLLRDRQTKADELGLDVEILPKEFRNSIESVMDIKVTDFATLSAHILALQERAGVAFKGDEETLESETDEDEDEDEGKAEAAPKDPVLGKLVKGLKGRAHQKGLRWLKQKMLKHIFTEWRKAVGVHDVARPRKSLPSTTETTQTKARTEHAPTAYAEAAAE